MFGEGKEEKADVIKLKYDSPTDFFGIPPHVL
jgi:hypothetical protein